MAYRTLGDKTRAQEALAKNGEVDVKVVDPLMDKLDTLVIGEHVNLLQGHDAFGAGRYADAAAAFVNALAADPESYEAAVNLATALAETGQCEAAAKLAGEIIQALEGAGNTASLQALRAQHQRYAAGPPCR